VEIWNGYPEMKGIIDFLQQIVSSGVIPLLKASDPRAELISKPGGLDGTIGSPKFA
jgi:hypothetical protein